jgi:hypothetical protein
MRGACGMGQVLPGGIVELPGEPINRDAERRLPFYETLRRTQFYRSRMMRGSNTGLPAPSPAWAENV